MVLTKKTLLNIIFVLWLASELFFQYTLISQIALLIFCSAIILFISKIRFHVLSLASFLFLCWSIINIVTGHTMDTSVSWAMTSTLMINFVFLLLFSQYYWYINDIKTIFNLFSMTVIVFSLFCMIIGFGSVISLGRMHINNINANTAAYYAVYACLWSFYLIIFEKKLTCKNIHCCIIR